MFSAAGAGTAERRCWWTLLRLAAHVLADIPRTTSAPPSTSPLRPFP